MVSVLSSFTELEDIDMEDHWRSLCDKLAMSNGCISASGRSRFGDEKRAKKAAQQSVYCAVDCNVTK